MEEQFQAQEDTMDKRERMPLDGLQEEAVRWKAKYEIEREIRIEEQKQLKQLFFELGGAKKEIEKLEHRLTLLQSGIRETKPFVDSLRAGGYDSDVEARHEREEQKHLAQAKEIAKEARELTADMLQERLGVSHSQAHRLLRLLRMEYEL